MAEERGVEEAFRKGGHWPGLFGGDYADFGSGGLHTKAVNEASIEFWRKGGLVTIGVHLYNPVKGKGGLRDTDVDLERLLAPGEVREFTIRYGIVEGKEALDAFIEPCLMFREGSHYLSLAMAATPLIAARRISQAHLEDSRKAPALSA